MSPDQDPTTNALHQMQEALRKGDQHLARRIAQEAAAAAPDREEPWLMLAAVSKPRTSIAYLQKALELNPNSKRARQGIEWAERQLAKDNPQPKTEKKSRVVLPKNSKTMIYRKPATLLWLTIFLVISFSFSVGFSYFINPSFQSGALSYAMINANKDTRTPTPTATFTPSPTFTVTPTFTPTPTNTITPTPTSTFTPSPTPPPTETPTEEPTKEATPTAEPVPTVIQTSGTILPAGVGDGTRWIEVSLVEQKLTAYVGEEIQRSFIVSTGKANTPTIIGEYRIYAKFRSADMTGEDYNLPNVPYVMYFFKDYGIHGTYWHNQFGTPMSHGCVNMLTEDAAWLFEWASIGTAVKIH